MRVFSTDQCDSQTAQGGAKFEVAQRVPEKPSDPRSPSPGSAPRAHSLSQRDPRIMIPHPSGRRWLRCSTSAAPRPVRRHRCFPNFAWEAEIRAPPRYFVDILGTATPARTGDPQIHNKRTLPDTPRRDATLISSTPLLLLRNSACSCDRRRHVNSQATRSRGPQQVRYAQLH